MNRKNKIGVAVDLYKIDCREFHVSDGRQLVQYGKYRLYFLYECMYWYAIKNDGDYYAFSIQEIVSMIGFDQDQKDQDTWLMKFIECIESSRYYIDFENSIRQYLKPMSNVFTTDIPKCGFLFFPIVKLIKLFHLNHRLSKV